MDTGKKTDRRLPNIFICLGLAMALAFTQEAWSIRANAVFQTGGVRANSEASQAKVAVENDSAPWGYATRVSRADLRGDRVITTASLLARHTIEMEGHRFYFGLGAMFFSENYPKTRTTDSGMLPQLDFKWRHPAFQIAISGTQRTTHAGTSFLLTLGIPVEFNTEFDYYASQPYMWSTNCYAFVSRYGGVIAGFEPANAIGRAGAWLRFSGAFSVRTLGRFTTGKIFAWEFAATFAWSGSESVQKPNGLVLSEPVDSPREISPRKLAAMKAPDFATMIRWGVRPAEALKISRSKDVCQGSAATRTILSRHRWNCLTYE